MKDQLFEMLLSLFEEALLNLRQHHQQLEAANDKSQESIGVLDSHYGETQIFQPPSLNAMRVLTLLEQVKLTKPAIQFLMRLRHTGMLTSVQFEQVMNFVMDSHLRYVPVSEVTMMAHLVLAERLSHRELLMLEFALDMENTQANMH